MCNFQDSWNIMFGNKIDGMVGENQIFFKGILLETIPPRRFWELMGDIITQFLNQFFLDL